MNTIQINNESEVNTNSEYKHLKDTYKKTKKSIKSSIYNIFASGKLFERNYSIRHNAECEQKENEYIKQLTELDYKQHEQMYNELLRLKKENIILHEAIKKSGFKVEVTHTKYYGDTETIIY